MFTHNSLCSHSTVYVPTEQFMSQDTFYVPRAQLMSYDYSLCHKSAVYDP